ncbi:Chitinase 1 [Chytriomyces hyalinus]|nr:Chitinase 1 [Chytriomyces hyalinus]
MPETTTPSMNTLTMPPVTRTSRPPTGTEMPGRKYKFIVYWGQGSGFATDGKYQLPLNEYCQTGTFDIINLSFLAVFGGQTPTKFNLNFANFGAYDNTNGPVAASVKQSFEAIGQQIRQCQNLGVKIVLALGGADGDHTVLSGMGTAFAETLHNSFFGGSSTDRPFGSDVILDGIDWDIEDARSDPNEMVKVNQYLAGRNPGILVTAAPQCIFPDVNLGPAFVLPNAGFSFLNMQFYNNPSCQLNGNFNFDVWVSQIAIPYNIPIAIGVPGSQQSAGSGFVSAATIKSAMDTILASSTLSPWLYGVMTWDASSTSASGLAQGIRSALDAL